MTLRSNSKSGKPVHADGLSCCLEFGPVTNSASAKVAADTSLCLVLLARHELTFLRPITAKDKEVSHGIPA